MFKTYCRALVEAFYNPRIYREAITAWQGFSGLYVALLSAVTGLILLTAFFITLNNFDRKHLDELLEQLPTVTIEDGLVSVNAPEPVIIKNSSKDLTIHIDTTQTEEELRATDTTIGIGRDFMFVQYQGQYERLPINELRNTKLVINKDSLRDMWNTNIPTVKTIAFPMIWLGQFLNLMISCAVVALLSYFVTTFMAEEYDFLTRMRLAALALTPASIISMLMKLTMAHQTAPWFSLLLALLYLYAMIILMRKLPDNGDTASAA